MENKENHPKQEDTPKKKFSSNPRAEPSTPAAKNKRRIEILKQIASANKTYMRCNASHFTRLSTAMKGVKAVIFRDDMTNIGGKEMELLGVLPVAELKVKLDDRVYSIMSWHVKDVVL